MFLTKGFVLSLERFQDHAALLSLMTPQGILFAYDGHFFQRYENQLPFLKESYFDITLSQGSDDNRFYLKKLHLLKMHAFEGESLVLWQFAQTFIALTQTHTERADLMFQSYYFFYMKLSQSQHLQDFETQYFYLTYIIFHGLDFIGSGPFIHHYQCTMENFIEEDDRSGFHENFALKKVQKQNFDKIFQYLCQHWYTCFSSHVGLEICYQCWIQTQMLSAPFCALDVISLKSNA